MRLRRQKKFLPRGKIYSMQDITSLKDHNNLRSSIKWVSTISFDKFARKSNNYETELAVLGCLNLTALIRCFVDFFLSVAIISTFVFDNFSRKWAIMKKELAVTWTYYRVVPINLTLIPPTTIVEHHNHHRICVRQFNHSDWWKGKYSTKRKHADEDTRDEAMTSRKDQNNGRLRVPCFILEYDSIARGLSTLHPH